jgi:hypothetical protein
MFYAAFFNKRVDPGQLLWVVIQQNSFRWPEIFGRLGAIFEHEQKR